VIFMTWNLGHRSRVDRLAFTLALVLAIVIAAGCEREPFPQATLGEYLYFDAAHMLEDPHTRLDATGIPEQYYAHLGWQRNPVIVTQWGLTEFSRYVRERRRGQRDAFITASDWLVETQRDDGGWPYEYPWFNGAAHMEPPWLSGIQQGNAISLLARAYESTGEAKYLDAARAAVAPFTLHVRDGGLRDEFDGIGPTLEEYPAPDGSTAVLNGWVFALIGLHELHALTGDELAHAIFGESEAALREMLPLYEIDVDGLHWSTYDLRHLMGGDLRLVDGFYMRIHAYLLEYLYAATGYEPYRNLWLAWEASARQQGVEDLPTDRHSPARPPHRPPGSVTRRGGPVH
jgi:heparosan-N-sulfate-glucuronate 5-epimerase